MDLGSSLFERSDEAESVTSVLRHVARGGSGSAVVFEGPAGIGKTSVLSEAAGLAGRLGFSVLGARGIDLEQDYAWGVVRQFFEASVVAADPAKDVSAASELARDLVTGDDHRNKPARGEYALIHSLYWLAADLAADRPLLLLADDLHWSDVASLRYLAYLAARLDGLPVVLLAAVRPGAERIAHIVSAVADGPDTAVRVLRPLTPSGTARLLAAVMRIEPDLRLATRCHEMTRGNPFLVKELGRQLVREGAGSADALLAASVPSVAQYVGLQLQRLPDRACSAMRSLAVLGDQSGADRVAELSGEPLSLIQDALSTLVSAELVNVTSSPTLRPAPQLYSISHPMIHAAVYDGIRPPVRAYLHAQAAGVMVKSGEHEKAATHLLRTPPNLADGDVTAILSDAADACIARGSMDGAVAYLRRLLAEDLGRRRLDVLTRLGMAEALVDFGLACEHLAAARALEQDPERRANLELALASATFHSEGPKEARNICISSLNGEGEMSMDSRLALQAWAELMNIMLPAAMRMPPIGGSDLRSIEACAGGQMLHGALAVKSAFMCQRRLAEEHALECIANDTLIKHYPSAGLGLLAAAWATLAWCDSPTLLRALDSAIGVMRANGSVGPLGPAYCYRAEVLVNQGNLREALSDAREGWDVSVSTTSMSGIAFNTNVLVRTLVEVGDYTEAEQVLNRASDVVNPSLGYIIADAEIRLLLIRCDYEQALHRIETARFEFEVMGIRVPAVCDWRIHLTTCLHAMGRDDEARPFAADAVKLAEEWGTRRAVGRSLRAAAMVESGRTQVDLLAESVRVLRDSDAKLELAYSMHSLGDALRRAKQTHDAKDTFQSALELADLCAAGPLRDEIGRDMKLIGMRPTSALTGPGALTPGERRVAEIAAKGRSNKEIAQALFITVKTVEVHLSSTFRKLQIRRRQYLAEALNAP